MAIQAVFGKPLRIEPNAHVVFAFTDDVPEINDAGRLAKSARPRDGRGILAAAGAIGHPQDVRDIALAGRLDNDLLKLRRIREPAQGVNGELKLLRPRCRWLT